MFLLIILFRTDPFTITPLASLTFIVLIISIMILQEIQSEDKALCFGIQLKMSLKMLSHFMYLKENIRLIFCHFISSNYLFLLVFSYLCKLYLTFLFLLLADAIITVYT